jgi:mutator protein MutT
MAFIDVAIAVICRDGSVLICQRKADDRFGGLWEFPGGKCEPGETPAQAVQREVMEELGIEVHPDSALAPIEHHYPKLSVRLHPFLCHVIRGEPRPLHCQAAIWIAPTRLSEYQFPAANAPLLEQLLLIWPRGDVK